VRRLCPCSRRLDHVTKIYVVDALCEVQGTKCQAVGGGNLQAGCMEASPKHVGLRTKGIFECPSPFGGENSGGQSAECDRQHCSERCLKRTTMAHVAPFFVRRIFVSDFDSVRRGLPNVGLRALRRSSELPV